MNNLQAFLDQKDYILIVSPNKSSFKINGEFLDAKFLNYSDGIYFYEVIYPVDLSNYYLIADDFNNSTLLEVRYYVKSDIFDKEFFYDKDDLGSTYYKEKTIFKLWSPLAQKVSLKYSHNNIENVVEMRRTDKGVFECVVYGDIKNALYNYIVSINNVENEVIDPYGYSSNANSQKSAVIDLNDVAVNDDYELPLIKSLNDCIIYETSVRDFSMDKSLGNDVAGLFKAFTKENVTSKNKNPIGIDYLKELGITHVQLMPILDFATVNENNISEKYNWGYDPTCYNSLEGSYSSNPNNPLSRIIEAKEMIASLHKNKIRVVLDVVFNHTYLYENSIYNQIVPRYYYLMDNHGKVSNGSFCGNDIDTTRLMVKKYFVDMCKRYVTLYNIDGLRFDLMGILTTELIDEIYNCCKNLNPSFIAYGEGWNMPSMLPNEKRASLNNSLKIPNISMFNDFFRDTVSGKLSDDLSFENGFLTGNNGLAFEFLKAFRGSIETGCYFNSPQLSINYIECHDNATLYDKIKIMFKDETDEVRNRIQLCCIASIIFSQGIPFIHSGMEFNRTKFNDFNSYKSSDEINMIRWNNVDEYQSNIKALKDFIKIRKEYKCFRLPTRKKIFNSIDAKYVNNVFQIMHASNGEIMLLLFNPTNQKQIVNLKEEYYLLANHFGYINDDRVFQNFKIMPYSFMILTK